MRPVRLFPDAWSVLHAEEAAARLRGPGCRRCPLHDGAAAVGIAADGRPGGLLVMGVSARGTNRRPFSGRDEAVLRTLVSRHWSGPVAYDSALRCSIDRGPRVTLAQYQAETAACRPHTAEILDEVRPARILAFGSQASDSLLGVGWQEHGRRVYGWVPVPGAEAPAPCFILRHAETYRDNPHHERWLTEDLAWALSVDVGTLPPPQYDRRYLRCETPEDVRAAVEELRAHGRIAHDVETYGRRHDRDFRVFCLALATVERYPRTWIVPEDVMRDQRALAELRRLYLDADLEVTGHNNKYDASAVSEVLGIPDLPCQLGGTDLQRKLQEVDVLARLSVAGLRVGMGGHKDEAGAAKAEARKNLLRVRRKDPADARRMVELAAATRDPKFYMDWAAEECARAGVPYTWLGSREGRRRLVEDWVHAAGPQASHDPDSYSYGLAERGVIETYCARDAVAAALLDLRESEEVERHPVHGRTYALLVRPAIRAVSQMERWGVPVDRVALDAFSTLLDVEMGQCMEECRRHGLDEPGSDDKVADLLFRQLHLPVEFRTEKERKPSVKDEALARLADRHPVVNAIRQHRQIQKMMGNYAGGLLRHVRADGRIHPSFRIAGTECMPAGELVLTDRGYLPVEQVRVGDRVLTHRGRARRVTAAVDNGLQPCLRVTTSGGLRLATTVNHEYLDPSGAWTRADDLRQGDALVVRGAAEEWRPVRGWGQYEVSSWGRVRLVQDLRNPSRVEGCVRTLSPKGRWGHLKVCLVRNGAQRRGPDRRDFPVHRLVAEAFLPRREGDGREVAHRNGVAWDNHVENLRWSTVRENRADEPEHQFREDHVLSVEDAGVQQTYGLTVEEDHSHVTGGIVTHNTGRMSCSEPNLQTIPSRGKWARLAKSVFAPRPGRVLVQLDYNQMELRIAAHLSGDPGMLDIYRRGLDYHAETAAFVAPLVWRTEYRKLTKEEELADPVLAQAMSDMRRAAKVVNFGLIYGKGDQSLAEEAQIEVAVAARVREAILGRFTVLDGHIQDHVNFCRRNGYTRTFHDGRVARMRPLPDISSRVQEYKGHAERAAWNTPVQGSASDYLLRALVRAVDFVLSSGIDATIPLQVHDSILGDVAEDDVDEFTAEVSGLMLDFDTRCPLVVDTKRGRSWGDLG